MVTFGLEGVYSLRYCVRMIAYRKIEASQCGRDIFKMAWQKYRPHALPFTALCFVIMIFSLILEGRLGGPLTSSVAALLETYLSASLMVLISSMIFQADVSYSDFFTRFMDKRFLKMMLPLALFNGAYYLITGFGEGSNPGEGAWVSLAIELCHSFLTFFIAPLLYFKQITFKEAMPVSIKALVDNMAPLFFYGLWLVAFGALACVPLGLGLIVFIPLVNITTFQLYLLIFESPRQEALVL